MKQLAADGAPEGLWLRAERQTGGRGRSGRSWVSPLGNLYASTLVRLRADDPPAPTLALAAGVALQAAILPLVRHSREGSHQSTTLMGPDSGNLDETATALFARRGPRFRGDDVLRLKWPNDLLVGTRKLAGILLERVDDAVIVGIGVNLAHHPDIADRRATDLAEVIGRSVPPDIFIADLAHSFTESLVRWRTGGETIHVAWLAAAHPVGTLLSTHDADGTALLGRFDGLDPTGACRLRLADGSVRLIHAGDLFLV